MSLDDDYDSEVAALYRKSAGKVRGYLLNMGTDWALADEVTDDAFLAARRRWPDVRNYDRPESWVFTVARNERSKRQPAHDIKTRNLHPAPGEWLPAESRDPGQIVPDRAMLQWALHQLPPTLREAVTLRHIEDLPIVTAAEIMNVNPGTVKRYTFEGLKRLRALLSEFHGPSEEASG